MQVVCITAVMTVHGNRSILCYARLAQHSQLYTAFLAPPHPYHSPQSDIDEGYGSQIVGGVLTAYPCPADTFRPLVEYGIMPVDCDPCAAGTNTRGKTGARSEAGCDGHAAGYGEPCSRIR
jgi:hypothetical protein